MSDAEITPEKLVAGLIALLEVEAIGEDLFRGRRFPGGRGRIFGGQVVAQALMAATRTIEGPAIPHSLHAYFMRPGDEDHPVDYRITREFDGRSFTTRRVTALQDERPILTLTASFQPLESGFSHQFPMPEVPPPEEMVSEREYWLANADRLPDRLRPFMTRPRPIEIRSPDPGAVMGNEKREPVTHSWFRTVAPVEAGADVHRAILAYASDMRLLGTGLRPHGVSWITRDLQMASLDHALWLHDEFRVDEWLLFASDSPWSGRARGFNRGLVFTRDGRLVASIAQEGLMRDRGEAKP